jgi:iron(II)-dependent oxidoreductase
MRNCEAFFFFFSSISFSFCSYDSFDARAAAALPIPIQPVETAVSTSFAHIPANRCVPLGADASKQWGWDNEFPQTETSVDAFAIRKTPVTNAEFVPFVAAGGYSRREFWSDEDWDWIQREKIASPVHWIPNPASTSVCLKFDLRVVGKRGEVFKACVFCFFIFFKKKIVIVPLEGAVLDWPVQVSFAEASAWCKWRGDGSRLPSEAEWYHAAFSESNEKGFSYRPFAWGSQTPTPFHGNFGFSRFSPSGVMEFPLSRKLSEEKYIFSFF